MCQTHITGTKNGTKRFDNIDNKEILRVLVLDARGIHAFRTHFSERFFFALEMFLPVLLLLNIWELARKWMDELNLHTLVEIISPGKIKRNIF